MLLLSRTMTKARTPKKRRKALRRYARLPAPGHGNAAETPPRTLHACTVQGLTQNQGRLLYMISLYTRPARSGLEKEEWVRKQALLVLIYEAVVAQVLDYDYAPASTIVNGHRRYFNKSQEGTSDVDFLREEDMLNGLKLSSKSYTPVTCYQVSAKGMALVKKMPKADKDAVHELVYAPGTRELLRVVFRHDEYLLVGPGGFERPSSVTDCEDVSYVSSAYIPQCLRFGGRPTLSNAHRAGECAVSVSNIRDELDEVLTLNSVSIVVAEFIPFGANQIVQMNHNLGSTERVQGGFFTALVDDNADGTKFEVAPGLTSVNILDYTLTKHINFEADIKLPEDDGIVQVETFGVSVNADGTAFYGMQVEAVMDRIKDNISLDHLSRLLADVHTDSSSIVDSVVSAYQRRLLNLIFNGDAGNRDKMNLIIANEITPHLTAEEYMDKGEYENELKQVLGDTRAAFDISEHDTLVFGETGLLIAGPNSRHHEPLLCSYLQFTSMDLFVRNYWNRMFLLLDNMKEVRRLINNYTSDPTSLPKIRRRLQQLSDNVRLMNEVLGYLTESLESCEIPPEPLDAAGRALYERLQIADLAGQLSMRVLDLKKNMDGAGAELQFLKSMASIVAENQAASLVENLRSNTRQLMLLHETNEKTSATVEILQYLGSAMFAFGLIDRLIGPGWSVSQSEYVFARYQDPEVWDKDLVPGAWQSFVNAMIVGAPTMWFWISLAMWAAVLYATNRMLTQMKFVSLGKMTVRIRIMQRLDLERFHAYVQTKVTALEERDFQERNSIIRVSWEEVDKEAWGGSAPYIVLEYDAETQYLHSISINYNRRDAIKNLALTAPELRNKLCDEMLDAQVFEDGNYTFREATAEDLEEFGAMKLQMG